MSGGPFISIGPYPGFFTVLVLLACHPMSRRYLLPAVSRGRGRCQKETDAVTLGRGQISIGKSFHFAVYFVGCLLTFAAVPEVGGFGRSLGVAGA